MLRSFWWSLAVDVLIIAVWSTVVGTWAAALPAERVAADGWLTRQRRFEQGGQFYVRLGIRRWKRHLPDLGRYRGGRSKKLRSMLDPREWASMAAETRRAERVHWLAMLAFPLQVAVHTGVVLLPLLIYNIVANLPCIAAQRYNRTRLVALGQRRQRSR